MKPFYNRNFLLLNDYGKQLYHEVAASLPVIDPHNHIDPAALSSNKRYENIYQLWVEGDPYKHRAMRIYGTAEELITGSRSDQEKFLAWADCFPHTAGNPLFHWCCMELKELFGIEEILTPQNAQQIWDTVNGLLLKDGYGALDIVKRFGVELLCTSDDLLDTLAHHIALSREQAGITCLPSLRSDSMITFNPSSFFTWLDGLQAITGIPVNDLASYKAAIINRLDFFDETGCLLSDHSLDSGFKFVPTNEENADAIFKKVLKGEGVTELHVTCLQSHLLFFLGQEYAGRSWKMQLHLGAHRYTSTTLRNKSGPAGGYACIGNTADVSSLCLLLDELDKQKGLPKTILYTLNPADNAVLATITGSFAEDGVPGKIQFGPAWWYNDHQEGITQQLLALSHYSLLGTSIGMTTDSRSILSFLRHDYYRRILCNLLGAWVEEGKLPDDREFVSTMVRDISYRNIKNWLKK